MAEALAAVKRDLGDDAVILRTRTQRRGGFLGIGRRTVIEVTATASQEAGAENQRSSRPAGASAAARNAGEPISTFAPRAAVQRAYTAGGIATSGLETGRAASEGEAPGVATISDFERNKRLARTLLEAHQRRQASTDSDRETNGASAEGAEQSVATAKAAREIAAVAASSMPNAVNEQSDAGDAAGATSSESEESRASTEQAVQKAAAEVARRFVLTPPGEARGDAGGSTDQARHAAIHPPTPADGESDRMKEELAAIRTLVNQVLERQTITTEPGGPALPEQLVGMYTKLIGQEVSKELAQQVLAQVQRELDATELNDADALRTAVADHLSELIPVAKEPTRLISPDDRPLTIALVGPTGVGKTTTLAKLAATFKLHHHRRVALITADTYRIAAVDQLRTYANIIGLPLHVALTPNEMRQAVESLYGEVDAIFIDTAGRSQNDHGRLEELKSFIEAANPHETHLVLSGTASEKVLLKEAEAFSQVGVDRVILTKLDEAVSFGVLVNAVRRIGLELSFFTTGQEVPDHIEPGRPERLAALILEEGMPA
jgi:flagellar biosynthesis protein FlhF